MRRLDVHIEELILHGFAATDRYRLGAAIERELARLFAEQGVPPSLSSAGELAQLDGGAFEVATGATAEGVGAQVAQAIYGGFRR
jgi:hypothetical protein